MRDEYDFSNARKNPYAKKLKERAMITVGEEVVAYFKEQSKECGIPYPALINMYLEDCVKEKKKLNTR